MKKLALFTVMYGNNSLYELELFGSVLSILCQNNIYSIEITVFSDRNAIDNFPFPITVINIPSSRWNEWTYNNTATHFIKMHTMKIMLEKNDCPVIYFDTDTIFIRPLSTLVDKIGEHKAIMHSCEGPISDHSHWRNFLQSIKKNTLSISVSPESLMYNSGIMGMLPEHNTIMESAITLAKEIYARDPIFTIDQFCTGTALSQTTSINTVNDAIFHYWGWRRKFIHITLEKLRSNYLTSRTSNDELILIIESLTRAPKIHIADRIRATLKFINRENSKESHFAYIAYLSSKRHEKNNTELANAWLLTCLNIFQQIIIDGGRSEISSIDKECLSQLTHGNATWLNQNAVNTLNIIMKQITDS